MLSTLGVINLMSEINITDETDKEKINDIRAHIAYSLIKNNLAKKEYVEESCLKLGILPPDKYWETVITKDATDEEIDNMDVGELKEGLKNMGAFPNQKLLWATLDELNLAVKACRDLMKNM